MIASSKDYLNFVKNFTVCSSNAFGGSGVFGKSKIAGEF